MTKRKKKTKSQPAKSKKNKTIGQLIVILIVGGMAVWFTMAIQNRDVANAERRQLEQEKKNNPRSEINTDTLPNPSQGQTPQNDIPPLSSTHKNNTSVAGESDVIFTASSTPLPDFTKVITNPSLAEIPVEYKGMTLSFNPEKHIPNWVAWELTADETKGEVPRYNKFLCDASIEGCPNPWDYSNSGYTRGHMAPAGDMKWDEEAMKQTFFMTNICPQANSLNSGAWLRLEEKCRQWAQADGSIIIICGPILTEPDRGTIGESEVVVPDRFFKVILSPNANPARGIGFVMNNGNVPGGMQKAAVSIREIESLTGHDFFSDLPDNIEEEVENQCDFPFWSTIK